MSPFDEYFRYVSEDLAEAVTADDGFDDRTARETFVDRFLEAIYPPAYLHRGGEIVDASGETSSRAGIVLYDRRLPVLAVKSGDRYLSAGVHAHVDVRVDLFGEVDHALSKVDSIKRLDVDRVPVDQSVKTNENHFTAIFAYEGPEPATFKESVLRHYADRDSLESCVDLICVLDEYVMITQHSGRDPGLSFLRTGSDSLEVFFINLAGAVSTNYWGHRPLVSTYMDRTEVEQF